MSNPTRFYAWTLPREYQDPWFPTFAALIDSMDASVRSVQTYNASVASRETRVETGAVPRVTSVISIGSPTAQMTLTGSTYTASGATPVWQVVSVAPFGRGVGSFMVVGNSRDALMMLTIGGFQAPGSSGILGAQTLRARVCVSGGSATDTVTIGDSNWLFIGYLGGTHVQYHWESVCSLSPGRYSGELQLEVLPNGTTAASQWAMDANDFAFLTIVEGYPGMN